MAKRDREPVNQAPRGARPLRTHVTQSTPRAAAQTKSAAGGRREPVNQSH